jgi:hypothetical protein
MRLVYHETKGRHGAPLSIDGVIDSLVPGFQNSGKDDEKHEDLYLGVRHLCPDTSLCFFLLFSIETWFWWTMLFLILVFFSLLTRHTVPKIMSFN